MTDDLIWLCIALITVGIVNFAFSVSDEKKAKVREAERREDRQTIRELKDLVQAKLGPDALPIHLQDLKRLSNDELRQLAAEHTEQIRHFAKDVGEGHSSRPYWETIPNWDKLSEAEKSKVFRQSTHSYQERSDYKTDRYLKEVRPNSVALSNEIIARLLRRPDERDRSVAIEHGMLAGVRPLEESATYLEGLARGLP